MIEDWVYNKNIDKPMQVYPMMFSQMFRRTPNATTEDYNIFPIPLTPEILEKNGFEKSYFSILTADGYKKLPQYKYKNTAQVQDICRNLITISYSDLEGDVYDIQCGMGSHIYDLKYVHQFQHALRLCGINKTIEL
jgi:hypothetical protein